MSFAKADQLLELAAMVGARRTGITLTEVEERFGCAHRTAQRMLGALEAAFPDVVTGFDDEGRKRWRLEGGHLRDFLTLKAEEIAALDIAITEIERTGLGPEARALRQLADKVRALVPHNKMSRLETDHEALLEAQGVLARPGPRPRFDEDVAAAVLEALKGCNVLEIDYRSRISDEPKVRRTMPYGVLSGARRYLVGCPLDDPEGGIRTYRFDAILSARVLDASFVRPADFDLQAWANRAFGVFQNDAEYDEVVWRFSPDARDHALGHVFHPDQVTETQPDGSLIVRFRASGHLEMCWYLYTWGDKVDVLAPPALRAMVEGHRRGDFVSLP